MVNYITSNLLNPVGAKLLAKDASGQRGVILHGAGGRPTMLIAGNSIALQSCRNWTSAAASTVTTNVAINAGVNVLTLATGGASAIAITSGDAIAVVLCSGQPWKVKTITVVGDVITLEKPLPRRVLAQAWVAKVTDTQGLWPVAPLGLSGFIRQLNTLSGSPYDILPGYGHGGCLARDVAAMLPAHLAFYRPNLVWLQMAENDVGTSTPADEVLNHIYGTAAICLKYGATPIVGCSLPSSDFTVAKSEIFDAINMGILNIASVIPGAVGVDPGAVYLDNTNPTYPRSPLPGWTVDTIHPAVNKNYAIALAIRPQLTKYFPEKPFPPYMLMGQNVTLSGTGGYNTSTSLQDIGIAKNIDLGANAGVTFVPTKDDEDVQDIVFGISGASTWGTQALTVSGKVYPMPTSMGPDTWVKAVAEIEIISLIGASTIGLSAKYTNTYTSHKNGGATTGEYDVEGILDGQTITIESPAAILGGITNYLSASLEIRPKTSISPSPFAGHIKIKLIGIAVVPQGEML